MKEELQQAKAVYDYLVEFFVNYSFQILGALLITIIGMIVASNISRLLLALLERRKMDITLNRFIANAAKIFIIAMVAIIAMGKLGISVTPFLAAIGAVSLGAGLDVQGLQSKYGAGFNIILARPFVVGDTIQVQGVCGVVKEVHLAFTVLTNVDEVNITIPNKHIVGEIIHNSHNCMLAEEHVGIAYSSDPEGAIPIIKSALDKALLELKQDEEQSTSDRPPWSGFPDLATVQ